MLTVRTWTEGELQGLITSGQEENIQLDFKKTIDTTDKAKKDLSKDVSSFANTIGGHIIIGMDEDDQATPQGRCDCALRPGSSLKGMARTSHQLPGLRAQSQRPCASLGRPRPSQ